MAASQRPGKKMVSTCSPETDRCTLVFEIAGYSLHKDLAAGKFIRSATFAVGRHDWSIRYYPNGDNGEGSKDGHVSVFVELMSKNIEVTALFDLRLVNQDTRLSHVLLNVVKPTVFGGVNPAWGAQDFKKKSEVEASPYLRDDRLVIECDITVIMGTPVSASRTVSDIPMPPSDLADDLGKLLNSKKWSDVTFMVKGEVFQAHKYVLAMRSPVFEAELYGPMKEKGRALLHFIYTDNLPGMDDLEDDESEEMIKHLLVAADRYAMERMKSICESILCERLDAESVASTLALADQHHCSKLKDACIGFINSSDRIMDDVVASQGYEHLKTACPTVIAEIWEKAIRSHNI
ncbi:hypothetical protein ACP70R_002940 [Stipagrostis hirtigluma subsp. patula]